MADTDVIKTGIHGLDDIFLGGILRDNLILVQGTAGTGKTLIGMEFIYRGIMEHNEPGMIVGFEISPDKLIRDAANFGWNLEQLQQQNKLKIILTTPRVFEQELRSPDSLLLETAAEIGVRRIFVDGIGLLRPPPRENNGNGSAANGPESYRELLQQVIEWLHRENLAAMLSHEIGRLPESLGTLEAAGFLADTIIQLAPDSLKRVGSRTIEILKSRGQDFIAGEHTMRITAASGVEVFRRVQSRIRHDLEQPTSMARRSAIGVKPLDDLIGGGLFDGSITMVVGISGSGKTVLSTQLLREGAIKEKRRGLLVSLDEHPAQIIRNAKTLGLDLDSQVESGMIHILFESPQELEVNSHFERIVNIVEKHDIKRLVIDGMTSYSTALESQRAYRDFFHALVDFSKFRLMTTFINYENPELFGLSSFMPDFPVSSIVDNIILLALVEIGSTFRRAISIAKARGSAHEFDTREFTIGRGGIELLPVDKTGALPKLSLESYYSLLSRAPMRFSPHGNSIGPTLEK